MVALFIAILLCMTYAKKTFGQNFLKDKAALEKIILAGDIEQGETIVEIGPGRGALTKYLLGVGARVVAFEIDPDMIEVLNEAFVEEIAEGQLKIYQADILETDVSNFITSENYKVIANIPYYITGLILRTFLESNTQPSDMVLLVQKEVAERIVDGQEGGVRKKRAIKTPKENILSLSVKVYGDVRYVTTVSAKSFSPAPKVDSAVIKISDISKKRLVDAGVTDEDFFKLIKQGFGQKRKTLVNNLKHGGCESEKAIQALESVEVDTRARAEILTLDNWLALARFLK